MDGIPEADGIHYDCVMVMMSFFGKEKRMFIKRRNRMKKKKNIIARFFCAIGRGFNFFIGRKPKVNSIENIFVAPEKGVYKLTVDVSEKKKESPKKVKRKTRFKRKYVKTKKKSTSVRLKTKKGRVIEIRAKKGR